MSSDLAMETRKVQGDRWKHYPAYKDSGVESVGEVPEHWGIKRLKYISTVNDGTLSETTDSDFELLYVDISSVDPVLGIKNKELMTFENAPSRARRKVCHGDVILSTVRTYLRAISPINDPEPNMIVSTGFAVIRPKDGLESRFAAYALCAPYFVDEVVANSVGVSYPAINANELITFNVALPSLPEQRAIAAFLDRETGRIDALIAKKERQIDLLQEKRTALISHAVTKGLDPNEVSASIRWIEARLRRFIKLQRGFDISGASECDGPYPVFSSGGLSGHSDIAPVSGPGVIVGRKGTLGTVYYSANNYWPHDTTLWVKEFGGNYPKFVYYFLIHMRLERFDVGAANPTLNRNHIHPIKVRFPDSTSQKVISDFLDGGVTAIENVKQTISESVIHLKEYRTALISAAVTGKIDVREELVS